MTKNDFALAFNEILEEKQLAKDVIVTAIESAMVSRDASDARMPSLPIAMPSVTAIVLNSIGVPPAACTPRRTSCARSRRVRLHGDTSDQVWITPTKGLAMAASSSPVARSMARAGARAGPDLIASLCIWSWILRNDSENAGPDKAKPPRLSRSGGFV